MIKNLFKLIFLFMVTLFYLSFLHSLFSKEDGNEDDEFCHICPNEEYI